MDLRRRLKANPITNLVYHTVFLYPVPVNINYLWNFGVLALITLVIQILSGIFLAMHYIPNADLAFNSVEHIMRDVNTGWLVRYIHANGASMFFIVVYAHLLRGFYFGSYVYPRELLWNIGVVILILMILTAFLGYVLVWGQMSYWAATVITNLVSVIPYLGDSILYWLWGGFSVANATLNKFFSLHFLFPFLILGLSLLHVAVLHIHGSNNPLGVEPRETITFAPYFLIKDYFSFIFYLILFCSLVFFAPNYVNHSDNYIPANPMSTPSHIVPEWYLLFAYAILRSIPHKLSGVIALLMALVVLMIIPYLVKFSLRSSTFRPFYKLLFWFMCFNVFLLSYIGGGPAEDPYILVGQIATFFYFFNFLVTLPMIGLLEMILVRETWTTLSDFVDNANGNKVSTPVNTLTISNEVKQISKTWYRV